MTGVESIAAVSANAPASALPPATLDHAQTAPASFAEMVQHGVAQVEGRVAHANDLVRAFALDDAIPVHQVTIALEEARFAVELAMQVRTRLIESYRELMNMQL